MSEIRVIEVPKWGLTMDEGTLSGWLIREGDSFRKGDELCEIETSKIANAVEASFDGVLRRVLAQPGDVLPVGGALGISAPLEVPEAEIDAFIAKNLKGGAASQAFAPAQAPVAAAQPAPVAAPAVTPAAVAAPQAEDAASEPRIPAALRDGGDDSQVFATPHARRLAAQFGINLNRVPGSGRVGRVSVQDIEAAVRAHGGCLPQPETAPRRVSPTGSSRDDSQVPATPVARRLARKLGINLHDCRVSGSRGRVCRADVEAAAALRQPAQTAAAVRPAASEAPAFEAQPLSGMRRAIAARLQESKRNAPHFRITVDLELDRLLALRQEINSTVPEVKISVNDLLIKACAQALVKVPEVNVQFDEASQTVRRFKDADIAVAVALERGLITPIIRAANRKSLAQISEEMRHLATKAKAGTLKPDEFQGGTFSISNLGMHGVRQFDAIINPPQAAILAVGAAEERVVAREGQMVIRTLMTLSLSCDHRVIDGALGAAFLKELKRLVEAPALMIL